jgi:hypothetical protein
MDVGKVGCWGFGFGFGCNPRNRHWDRINHQGVGGGIVHRPVGNGRFSISMPCHARCPVNPEGAFDLHADFWEPRIHSRNINDRVGSPSENGIVE